MTTPSTLRAAAEEIAAYFGCPSANDVLAILTRHLTPAPVEGLEEVAKLLAEQDARAKQGEAWTPGERERFVSDRTADILSHFAPLLAQRDADKRRLETISKLDRYDLEGGEACGYTCSTKMVKRQHGDWVSFVEVIAAIDAALRPTTTDAGGRET